MTWTKAHSKNAVAAKERKRSERASVDLTDEPIRNIRIRKLAPRFWISIRDRKIGDSLTLSLNETPWRGRFLSSDGQELSAAKICRALKVILCHE